MNIVFHAAATVRFDEKLKKAAAINVRATRDLSLIAQQMKQLKSFVQVSTTYSNCVYDLIEEKVYPPSTSHHNLIRMIDSIDDFLLEKLTPTYVMIDTGAVDAFEK